MKEIVNLTLQTEFSFKNTFGKIDDVLKHTNGNDSIGIADINGTFGHTKLEQICDENGLKPIFGVRLTVVDKPEEKVRGRTGPEYIFIAKNDYGLQEIYRLTKIAFEKFYYKPMIGIKDMLSVSDDVFVICECPQTLERLDYIALSARTPRLMLDFNVPKIATINNRYCTVQDKGTYQLLAGARKAGVGYNYLFNNQTYPQHILSTKEWYKDWGLEEAIENTHVVSNACNARIPRASMVKYSGTSTLEELCQKGAIELGINLAESPYKERYDWEMGIIKEKQYTDYFMIVSEMIREAKKTMLVGPARGSSAGSLVCYLSKITTIDPIKFDLLFERFIDLNRKDLPDIDVDFPDDKRQQVIKWLMKRFKTSNVCHISNVNKLKARSAIGEISMALSIPPWETDLVKEAIVDRSGGDARAKQQAADTLTETEIGKDFLEKYPAAKVITEVEGHSTHAGKHAAGIIVCNDELTKYGGINAREGTIMMDKKEVDYKNLLKIDVLGLRTLTVLEDCANQLGMDYTDYYTMPLDDEETFEIFADLKLTGIFQFEGSAMRALCKEMIVGSFNDIVAVTALARPGPLHSGGASMFARRHSGIEEVEYISGNQAYIDCTKDTLGVIIYQEQLMEICRVVGKMNYEEVSAIRVGSSKTLGKDFFEPYFESFLKGALENGVTKEDAAEIWENMVQFGSWGMNKGHTVAYGLISYWCAYMKKHHPLEFTVANLRNARNNDSALKILREAVEDHGIEYIPIDPDLSEVNWSVRDGVIYGGLKNIVGIADKKADAIIKARNAGGKGYTPSIVKILMNPKTPFDTLYPCKDLWGDYYKNPHKYGLEIRPSYIKEIKKPMMYTMIGKVIKKDIVDLNEYNEIMKRGGVVLEKNTKALRIIIQDDTDQIMVKISAGNYDRLDGDFYAQNIVVDDDWIIVKGKLDENWRIIYVNAIHILKQDEIEVA